MKPTLVLFLLLTTLQSPAQSPITIPQSHLLLNGTWNWYRTYQDYDGDFLNRNETPNSCNCTKKIIFRDDSILEYYSNDTLISAENHRIENSSMDPEDHLILRSKEFMGYLKFRIVASPKGVVTIGASISDSLGIGWFGSCATLRYFVRENAGGK